jgi:hypothetical protein
MNSGTLGIVWENSGEPSAAPIYALTFASYSKFKDRAQRVKRIVGDEALQEYLLGLNFPAQDAESWLQKLKAQRSVSIRTVMMSPEEIATFDE